MINGLTDNGLLRNRNEDNFFYKSEKTKLGGLCAQHHLKSPGDWGWSWWQRKDNIS